METQGFEGERSPELAARLPLPATASGFTFFPASQTHRPTSEDAAADARRPLLSLGELRSSQS